MTSQWLFTAFVLLVGLERLAELVVSKRHAAWALSRGGIERGQSHYPVMVVLHTGLLVGAVAEVWLADRPFVPALGWVMLALVAGSQGLRWWCISTLGNQWNTRVIVVPGLPLVRRGPYGLIPHPNYVAVVVEGLALPLVHTAWVTALVFTVANAALLTVRIRVEDAALREIGSPAVAPSGAAP
jgi:methyltransferase